MIPEYAILGTTIELTTVIGFSILVLFGLISYFKKISAGIGLFSGIAGFIIGWVFAPYNQIVIGAMKNSMFHGYDISLTTILGFIHWLFIIVGVIVAAYNLYKSDGKIVWA